MQLGSDIDGFHEGDRSRYIQYHQHDKYSCSWDNLNYGNGTGSGHTLLQLQYQCLVTSSTQLQIGRDIHGEKHQMMGITGIGAISNNGDYARSGITHTCTTGSMTLLAGFKCSNISMDKQGKRNILDMGVISNNCNVTQSQVSQGTHMYHEWKDYSYYWLKI